MERGLSLLIATAILFVAPGVQAADNLSFANNTELNITRTGCGVTKLCIETPSQCDPAGNSTCLFASVKADNASALNGANLSFHLSGNSTGYIALGLTVNASQGTTALYVCAQNSSNNGAFFFMTMQMNNTKPALSTASMTVTSIRGKINGNMIQCGFIVPGVNPTTMTRSSDSTTPSTIFSILLGSGSVNGSVLGDFGVTLNSGPLNLVDPRANVATTTVATTTANATAMTTANATAMTTANATAITTANTTAMTTANTTVMTTANTTVMTTANATAMTTTTKGASVALHPHAVTLLLSVLTLCVQKTT